MKKTMNNSMPSKERENEAKPSNLLHNPNFLFEELMRSINKYITAKESLAIVRRAYEFASRCHGDQKRRSGEAYITHPIAVAIILAEMKVDIPTIVSALLHDVVEDTETPVEEIKDLFGGVVAHLVDGLTKIRKIKFRSNQEKMAENFRKMILAMAKDIRVIIVKLADRLHNMRTISALSPTKRQLIAQETLDIYAPIANRLGIYGVKSELEDLCLKETKYEIYKDISTKIAKKKKEREDYIEEVRSILVAELKKYGFQKAQVFGRPKHFYSIYRKMVFREIAFEDIHDLFAFRIVLDTVKDCYEALGIVHSMWKPMPGRFKDYIAMPKANLYQSLHTTVIRPNGSPAEIQIRTREMHHVCEFGVAAHWSYKEQDTAKNNIDQKNFNWLRQIMELQHDVKDPNEFMTAVKLDLFQEEIFVFTPRGDVVQLRHGATPLDLAFAIHTDIGLTTVGAKVNGRINPLRRKLKSGDIVEILTSKNQKPSKDWLNFVCTSKARNKIKSFLRTEQRSESQRLGRELLNYELNKIGLDLEKLIANKKIDALIKASRESTSESLFASAGYGKINVKELVRKVYHPNPASDEEQRNDDASSQLEPETVSKSLKTKSHDGVIVSGVENVLVSFARCCNPLPGESIIGFITRGRGVSVHRTDCARALDLDPNRRIPVSWQEEEDSQNQHFHLVSLKIVSKDRQGVLADVTLAISHCGANILKAQVDISQENMGVLLFEISLKNIRHLNQVIERIESLDDIVFVERESIVKTRKGGKSR